jgi:hypothetical protein
MLEAIDLITVKKECDGELIMSMTLSMLMPLR